MPNLFGGGGTTINYPQQQGYGEALSESLKAQVDLLRGTGEFEDTGGLQELLTKYEAPMRKETAQLDTDVLRQTLLGAEQKVVRDPKSGKYGLPQGVPSQPVAESGPASNYLYSNGSMYDQNTGSGTTMGDWLVKEGLATKGWKNEGQSQNKTIPEYLLTSEGHERFGLQEGGHPSQKIRVTNTGELVTWSPFTGYKGAEGDKTVLRKEFISDFTTTAEKSPEAIQQKFDFHNPNIPADPSKAGQAGYDSQGRTLFKEGDVVREGTGMLDLFGPTEAGMVTKEIGSEKDQFEQYVQGEGDLLAHYEKNVAPTNESMADWGKRHYAEEGKAEGRELPAIGETIHVSRRAGFDPDTGEFLGLTTLGADVSEQLARRQRGADIYDVEQLGGKATEAYRQQGVQYDAAGNAIEGTGIAGTLAEARRLGPEARQDTAPCRASPRRPT